MTAAELTELDELLAEEPSRRGRLTDFEVAFIDTLRPRVEQYRERTSLSEKQWAVIRAISVKVFDVG